MQWPDSLFCRCDERARHFAQKDVASERRRSGRRGGVLSPRGRWALISSANMLYSGWPGSDVRHRWTRVPAVSSSPCACEGALKERKFWPGQCRMRDRTVEKLLMVRPGETFHQEGIPLARGLSPLLSTPPPAPLVTAASGDPVQSIQVVAGSLGPQIGHYQEFEERAHSRRWAYDRVLPAVVHVLQPCAHQELAQS